MSAKICGELRFTRATRESEYPRQESHLLKHEEKFIGQQWTTEDQTLLHIIDNESLYLARLHLLLFHTFSAQDFLF